MHSTVATAAAIRCNDFAGATVMFDAVLAAGATLNFYVSDEKAGTYRVLGDFAGTPVSVVLPAPGSTPVAFPMPDEVFAAAWVKIVPTASAIDGAACTLTVKS